MHFPILAALVLSASVMDCPGSPNCVSSLASDPARRVEPLAYPQGGRDSAMNALLQVLQALPRAQIVSQSGDVIRVVVGSAIFRFKDDLEFRFDPGASVIHVRSASRTGYWDLGVNRRRVESIRAAFAESFGRRP